MNRYHRPTQEAELSCIIFEVVMSFNAQLQRSEPTHQFVLDLKAYLECAFNEQFNGL